MSSYTQISQEVSQIRALVDKLIQNSKLIKEFDPNSGDINNLVLAVYNLKKNKTEKVAYPELLNQKHYKGYYTSLTSLTNAVTNPKQRDFAFVENGRNVNLVIWDAGTSKWRNILDYVDNHIDNEDIHTTKIEKTKLAGIEEGANKNVQSDWKATSGDAFIKNKPNIPTPIVYVAGANIDIDNANPSQPVINATVNNNSKVQSDWATSDINDVSFIKNKPNIPTSLSNITQTDIDNWNKTGLELKELTTEDLNTVKESGFYLQSAWTRAIATRNYPRKQSGYLTVFTKSNGVGYQTFVTEKNIVYLRKARANGTFKPWQELKGSNYIFDDEETTAHTPQHYLDNYRLIMKTEFKTVSSLGLTAETGYCALKTFVSRELGKAVQQAFCFDTGNVYKRYGTSPTTWSAWELNGATGADGKSAYQIYVDNVPAGTTVLTETQWLASLKGDKGDKGDTGTGGGSTVSQLQTSTSINTSTLIDTHSQNGKHVMILNGTNDLNVNVDSGDKFCATYQKTGTGKITFNPAVPPLTIVEIDGTNIIDGAIGSSATVSIVGSTIYLRIANA